MRARTVRLSRTLWMCAGFTAALMPFAAFSPAHADQQNLLPTFTDDSGWVLKKQGQANATLGYNNERMVMLVQVSAVDGQLAHVEVDYPGVPLAQGRIYLLSFEGRSNQDEAFALTVHAGTAVPHPHSVGLDQTVYLTGHWTPFHLIFTARDVAPGGSMVPQFLFGHQTGNVYLRNASLVQLAGPPPPDAGLPDVISPHKGETTLNGSLYSLLPNHRGFVMWATGRIKPGRPEMALEPSHLQTVYWSTAQATAAGKPLAFSDICVGDLVSVAGVSVAPGAILKARQLNISHRLEPSPPKGQDHLSTIQRLANS